MNEAKDLKDLFYHSKQQAKDETSNSQGSGSKRSGNSHKSYRSKGDNLTQEGTTLTTNKTHLMFKDNSLSRERKNNIMKLNLKKIPFEKAGGNNSGKILPGTLSARKGPSNGPAKQNNMGGVPQVGKRRPLVIRKNNFVQ